MNIEEEVKALKTDINSEEYKKYLQALEDFKKLVKEGVVDYRGNKLEQDTLVKNLTSNLIYGNKG